MITVGCDDAVVRPAGGDQSGRYGLLPDIQVHKSPDLALLIQFGAPFFDQAVRQTLDARLRSIPFRLRDERLHLAPAPPNERLAEYYAWLEAEHEFTRHVFRTDYQFVNLTEAVELTEFFFGPVLADKIRENNWVRLPEWTGMWVKHLMHA